MTKSLCSLALLLGFAAPESLHAQNVYDAFLNATRKNAMTFVGGLDFTTAFYFRGILQENQELIMQPWWNVTASGIYDGGSLIENLDIGVQNWNSIQFAGVGIGGESNIWFRSDLSILFAMDMSDTWHVTASYNWYASPNNSFKTIREVMFDISYDDDNGLNPSAVIAIELDGGGTADGINPSGTFLGLGITPETQSGDFDLTFPMRIGLSLGDYFQDQDTQEDDPFGYAEAGVEARKPIDLLGSSYGDWELRLGFHVIYLGDAMAKLNSDLTYDFFGFAGLAFTF
jgi:hypothetical protein